MKTLGIGLIGCGNISTTYLDLAPLFNGVEIRSVTDLNADLAAEKAQTYGVRAESLNDMLAADDIDMVVNLTIPRGALRDQQTGLAGGQTRLFRKTVCSEPRRRDGAYRACRRKRPAAWLFARYVFRRIAPAGAG